jgi:hypothetical protein
MLARKETVGKKRVREEGQMQAIFELAAEMEHPLAGARAGHGDAASGAGDDRRL